MGRHERRASLARYRRESCRELLTYLVEVDDPLEDAPLLQRAAHWWLDALTTTRARHCIVCSEWLVNRQHVGAMLFATPVVKPVSASVSGICKTCWQADLPLETLQRAALVALQPAVGPGARFEDAPR